jgi:hypothetical protein
MIRLAAQALAVAAQVVISRVVIQSQMPTPKFFLKISTSLVLFEFEVIYNFRLGFVEDRKTIP